MTTNLRSEHAHYTFRYMGSVDGFHALRAPTWNTDNRRSLDAQQFESEVAEWLMDHTRGEWHLGCAKVADGYEPMPHAFETMRALCVKIELIADLMAFERQFATIGTQAALEVCDVG